MHIPCWRIFWHIACLGAAGRRDENIVTRENASDTVFLSPPLIIQTSSPYLQFLSFFFSLYSFSAVSPFLYLSLRTIFKIYIFIFLSQSFLPFSFNYFSLSLFIFYLFLLRFSFYFYLLFLPFL